jgi:Flp pilus assembly secretin CpaC
MRTPTRALVACLVIATLANAEAQQIHIKAWFIEVPGSVVGDVYLGSINVNATTMPLVNQTDGLTSQRIRSDSLTGIMTGSQFKTAIQTINRNPGFKELAEPEATTTSGRQMQMRSTQVITIITNFSYQQISNVSAIFPQTNAMETGPILDTVATVRADGYRIDLKATASVMEFLGYDKSTNTAVAYNSAGQKINLPTILPSYAIREASADITMYDGQTAILGGMKAHFYDGGKEVSAEPDYFVRTKAARGQRNETEKELLVFITVTLVDPAGNRIHSDDEIPFAKNSIPQQSDP